MHALMCFFVHSHLKYFVKCRNITGVEQLLQKLMVSQNQSIYWAKDLKLLYKLAETIFFEVMKAGGDFSSYSKCRKNQTSNMVLKSHGFLQEIFMRRIVKVIYF